MSTIEDAVKSEMSKPEVRKAVVDFENVILEAAKNAVESLIPPFLKPLVVGLADAFAEKGITAIEHLTDEALAGFGTVHVETATAKMAITVTPLPNSDKIFTKADLAAAEGKK